MNRVMKPLRKLTKSGLFRKSIAGLLALYIKCVYRTTPWTFENEEMFDKADLKPLIVVFWHGRLAMLPCAWKKARPFHMLLSKHSDGQIIGHVLKYFGIASIFGSSTRGGVEAGLSIVEKLTQGDVVGITPDGPRGPTQKCSSGVLNLAKLTAEKSGKEVMILPLSYSVKRHKILRSWDRFMLPLPFGKQGFFVLGDPLFVHPDITKDELILAQKTLESGMNKTQDRADKNVQKL